jgi:hypothetical protein
MVTTMVVQAARCGWWQQVLEVRGCEAQILPPLKSPMRTLKMMISCWHLMDQRNLMTCF